MALADGCPQTGTKENEYRLMEIIVKKGVILRASHHTATTAKKTATTKTNVMAGGFPAELYCSLLFLFDVVCSRVHLYPFRVHLGAFCRTQANLFIPELTAQQMCVCMSVYV